MAEVRLDLIKLDGLIRFRSADALLTDPELFGPARDPGRLFSDLLRKAQTSGAQTSSTSAFQGPGPKQSPAAQDSQDKQASASNSATQPEQPATRPASQDRQREQPEERSEPTSTGEQTNAANEAADASAVSGESTAADNDADAREASSAAEDKPQTQQDASEEENEDQDAAALAAAAQLEVSATIEPEGPSQTAPDQAAAHEGGKPKSDAQPSGSPNAPQTGPQDDAQAGLLETGQTETDQQADKDSAKHNGPKPATAEPGSDRALAAKAALGTDEATGQAATGEQTAQAKGKGRGSKGTSGGRARGPEAASEVSTQVDRPAASAQTPTAPTPQVSAPTVQTDQTGQQSGSSESAGPTAVQPVARDGESPGTRAAASLRTQTHRSARAAPASPHDGPEGNTQAVDRVRFVQRVARAFEALGQRRGTVRLRLHPPELGSLRLEVTVQRGMMTARLETETHAARNLLLDNLPALRERLAQQDIRVQQFQVDLMDQPPGGTHHQMPEGWDSGQRSGSGGGSLAQQSGSPDDTEVPEPRSFQRPGDGSRLNVVV